ncbi:response regulator transcription factor [Thauera sp. WH-1]|uniref:response regulator transcription factor n=1 Tax=Thauera sp. WH-1 TaxID=3398230 RepID=UPI0039FBD1D0
MPRASRPWPRPCRYRGHRVSRTWASSSRCCRRVSGRAGGRGRPVVVLYVRDPAGRTLADAEAVRQLFNLTPTETAVALKLADGASLEEAAEALGIRRNTARAHLRAIFSKTGVRRQTELVRILLNSVAPLRVEA